MAFLALPELQMKPRLLSKCTNQNSVLKIVLIAPFGQQGPDELERGEGGEFPGEGGSAFTMEASNPWSTISRGWVGEYNNGLFSIVYFPLKDNYVAYKYMRVPSQFY